MQRAEYSLIETLPSVQALSESEEKARDSMETRDALVIAQTAFENYLASLVDSTELKMDEVTGRLQVVLPSQLPPLRVLHQGFRELRGAIGYFFVTLYEYTRKTVLIRVHDNAESRRAAAGRFTDLYDFKEHRYFFEAGFNGTLDSYMKKQNQFQNSYFQS